MKRLLALLLLMLVLAGCTPAPIEETTIPPDPTQTTLPAVEPTEPSGAYEPNSALEQQTDGALRVYTPDIPNVYDICTMGQDVLVFSNVFNDADTWTKITRLAGENLYETASIEFNGFYYPTDPSFAVTDKGIFYYDPIDNALVQLDTSLKEVARTAFAEEVTDGVLVAPDHRVAYYLAQDGIREFSLDTGLSRLLKEQSYPEAYLESLLLGGSVLCYNVWDEQGTYFTRFISTENGSVLWEGIAEFSVYGTGEMWYAIDYEGTMRAYLFGNAENEPQMLVSRDYTANGVFIESIGALVTEKYSDDYESVVLEYYDMESGACISDVELSLGEIYNSFCAVPDTRQIYFFSTTEDGAYARIYRWDADLLPSGDTTDYIGPYYTLTNPDEAGIAACRTYADEIGEKYGVRILIAEDAVAFQPWDYSIIQEYQVPVIEDALARLDALLALYPKGMLSDAAWSTPDGRLNIALSRALYGNAESGSLDSADGVQFFDNDGNSYLAVVIGWNMEQTLYHELYHALENRLMSASSALYDWEYLNPDGFDYFYSYTDARVDQDFDYTEGEDRYFIDPYSKTFPREDRARIMEYAMAEGNEAYFETEQMQAKLLAICKAMREAFGLKKSPDTYLWEQYLQTSLAYEK